MGIIEGSTGSFSNPQGKLEIATNPDTSPVAQHVSRDLGNDDTQTISSGEGEYEAEGEYDNEGEENEDENNDDPKGTFIPNYYHFT